MATSTDRLKGGLTTMIRRTLGAWIVTRVDYLALYACRVVTQNSDGSLELIADDERVGTLSRVPIRYGIPGVNATVPNGSRCYVTWAAGDPRKAIVVDWESGTASSIKLGNSSASEALVKGTSFKTALDTFLGSVSSATTVAQIAAAALAFKNTIDNANYMLSTVVTTT